MELNRKLVMTFKTTDDKKVSLTVDNPIEDLTEEEVKTAMELIKEKNIFAPGGADLASLVSAIIIGINVTLTSVLNVKDSPKLSFIVNTTSYGVFMS